MKAIIKCNNMCSNIINIVAIIKLMTNNNV